MPRPASLLRPLSIAVALFAAFAAARMDAHAIPVQFTSGTLSGCAACNDRLVVSTNVAGDGLVLNGNSESYRSLNNGQTASATFNAAGVSVPTLTYLGTNYFVSPTNSVLNFVHAPFTFPGQMPAGTDIFIEVPFTVTGRLDAAAGSPGGPVVFSFDVTGAGTVRLQFRYVSSSIPTPMFQGATYTFQPAAIPEPATMLLLATGLAGVAAGARKRRKV